MGIYCVIKRNLFHDTVESIQYNACLVITGTIITTVKEILCQEIGLKPLKL